MILYGAPVREKIKEEIIAGLKKHPKELSLAIVQVGNREDSNVYIKQKQKFAEEIGVKVILNKFSEEVSQQRLETEIQKLNIDENINGIIIQLPLPEGVGTQKILSLIKKAKDVDGLNRDGVDIVPATARGVMALLDFYNIEIKNKKAVVIGQGILAGKPVALELEKRGASVFRCDINTKNISDIAQKCDLLISAVGKAGLITKEFVNDKQVVIDVGINRITPPNPPLTLRGGREEKPTFESGVSKLVGDVVFAEVEPLVAAISPVPCGVGLLTVACLFQNLLDLSH